LYVAIAETLKEDEDFKPNALETLFTEPTDHGLFIKPQDLAGGALLNGQIEGMLTVDMINERERFEASTMREREREREGRQTVSERQRTWTTLNE